MIRILLLIIISSVGFALPVADEYSNELLQEKPSISNISPILSNIDSENADLIATRKMLQKQAPNLSPGAAAKVLTIIACVQTKHLRYNPVLTVIDYSIPSNKKRLWVFDLTQKKLLYYTHVSHGITSGKLYTNAFSNKNNSKASSFGVYLTKESYYGREGYSLRLSGLDYGFNNNAMNRYIVMHGGWYMTPEFIKKYGRPGRSWGCPSLPMPLHKKIINSIKDDTLLVVYYPNDRWLAKSSFLNCKLPALLQNVPPPKTVKQTTCITEDNRAPILFADLKNNGKREQNDPIITIKADIYQRLFQHPIPLDRMLRRPIDNAEYIALSPKEFQHWLPDTAEKPYKWSDLSFVMPFLVKEHGRFATQMKIVDYGKIENIQQEQTSETSHYKIQFTDHTPLVFKTTTYFIRWLGL